MSSFKLDIGSDGIALITWDMADRSMNVITMDVIEELGAVVDKVTNDSAIKGAVITSGKPSFCGGADLTMLDRLADIFATMAKNQGEQAAAAMLFEDSRKLSQRYCDGRRIRTGACLSSSHRDR
jgi:3-hydroxyacyl-CoA dehydrogenase/enoyl-CoA hydratase/3-hydroxybutyryl-CoA epimerase